MCAVSISAVLPASVPAVDAGFDSVAVEAGADGWLVVVAAWSAWVVGVDDLCGAGSVSSGALLHPRTFERSCCAALLLLLLLLLGA